jgi:signal transduction histidine kinase
MLYLYRKRQFQYGSNLEQLRLDYEKTLLTSQLEIQEQTFRHISREIHDNINLSLTLAKLNLHTMDSDQNSVAQQKIGSSIELITKSILELSDISKSLNADVIIQQGLLKAVEDEIVKIRQTGLFEIDYIVIGNPVFMSAQKELIIFRIIQEAFNNIIKHASAKKAELSLNYSSGELIITVIDDGRGFDANATMIGGEAGIKNMQTRSKVLNGRLQITSGAGEGSKLTLTIPVK